MVIDWQIVLVCAVSQHFGSWLTVISVFQLLQVFQLFISPQAKYIAMWSGELSLFVADRKLSLIVW